VLRVVHHRDRALFSFSHFFLFFSFTMCIHNVFKHLVGAEAGCNWYLFNINIFPLSKKVEQTQRHCKSEKHKTCAIAQQC
jgi:hypothetical protein